MLFKEVIGQAAMKHHLAEMVQQNRLSHALLFLGKDGTGSLPLAMAFAQYIVCEKVNRKKETSAPAASLFGDEPVQVVNELQHDACGECSACKKAMQMVHPDVHFSFPTITDKQSKAQNSSKLTKEFREFFFQNPYGNVYDWLQSINAENKQGNISAEECNDIIKQLSLKSFESDYKILVMWMPEYLGNEGNKLLKLIEEPPPNTLFILVAENEEKILQTILSRTQLVKIPLLEDKEVEDALIKRTGTQPEQARQVAAMAQGNYHEAVQLLQHAGEDWLQLVTEWMTCMVRSKYADQLKWIDEVTRLGREKQKQLLQYFNHLVEQAVRLRIIGDSNTSLSATEKDFAERLNKITSVPQQQAILTELDNATYYVERNANPKMLFHALTIKMFHIIINKVVVKAA